jgi:pyruvate kinase
MTEDHVPLQVRTKIVATVGPACEAATVLERLIGAGVDVFRLNFAHGAWDWHSMAVERIRAASQAAGRVVAILQDLGGPKLRLGELPGGARHLALGDRVRIVKQVTGRPDELETTYPDLIDDLQIGHAVMLADGAVALQVTAKGPGGVEATVTLPGEIRSRQGINAPGVNLHIDSLTEKDLHDLDWTARHAIDYVGLSFVRRAADIERLRAELDARASSAHIVAKIEKPEALDDLDAIIDRADALMVARGDLGVEIDVARLPMVQKQIVRRCQHFGVPVIVATQMLESMRTSNRPTRAEASDVANAILDGADAVMLSGETATGQYPVEAVETMNRIALETERALHLPVAEFNVGNLLRELPIRPLAERVDHKPVHGRATDITLAAVEAASQLAERVKARLIVAATDGGHTALGLSKQRGPTPILALSDHPATVRRMALYWGVLPVLFERPRVPQEYVAQATAWIRTRGLANVGDRLVFVFGRRWAGSAYNTMLVQEVS